MRRLLAAISLKFGRSTRFKHRTNTKDLSLDAPHVAGTEGPTLPHTGPAVGSAIGSGYARPPVRLKFGRRHAAIKVSRSLDLGNRSAGVLVNLPDIKRYIKISIMYVSDCLILPPAFAGGSAVQ
jgi:hypothetical protein